MGAANPDRAGRECRLSPTQLREEGIYRPSEDPLLGLQNPDAPEEVNYPVYDGPPVEIPSLTIEGLSILKPPYGVLSAIDMNKGEVIWTVPHGETPDNVRNHPKLRDMDIPRTGQRANVGTVVTKTLVIVGDQLVTNPGDNIVTITI